MPVTSVTQIERFAKLETKLIPTTLDYAGVSGLRNEAKRIRDKYVDPPQTTDFALLFLPTEGLYAEALRRPGLADSLQREHRVVLAGPTTLFAVLNSLQMGFRTLAIQKQSGEVWRVLGEIKTQFQNHARLLGKVKENLDKAGKK